MLAAPASLRKDIPAYWDMIDDNSYGAFEEWSSGDNRPIFVKAVVPGAHCTLGLEGLFAPNATPHGLMKGLSVAGGSGYGCCATAEAWLLH